MAKAHPDTGIIFSEFKVPYIKESVEACKAFHAMLSDLHSIGWDVAITQDGPVFIEGNDNYELQLAQVFEGGMKSSFDKLFR